jgi:hypothetical protein
MQKTQAFDPHPAFHSRSRQVRTSSIERRSPRETVESQTKCSRPPMDREDPEECVSQLGLPSVFVSENVNNPQHRRLIPENKTMGPRRRAASSPHRDTP